VKSGAIPKDQAENLVIVCGVFIHWDAADDKKIYQYNYEATKLSIERAMKSEPKVDSVLAQRDTASHPFYAG
jgi:5,6,7,8-tetrahydromethanopterin hydro-lyase